MLDRRDGARRDPRSALQILGSDTRQREPLNRIAGAFPGLARNTQHRRLAGARIAGDHSKIPRAHYMRQSGLLIYPQHKPVPPVGIDGSPPRGRREPLISPVREAPGRAIMPLPDIAYL